HISGGLPDSVYSTNIQLSNGTTGGMKTHYVYNSDGNPTVGAQYNYNPNIGDYDPTPDAYQHYYYQSTTAVSNVAKQDVAIKVYPNPAANEINISMTGTQHGALTYITLINALGQTVHTESLPWI